MTILDDDPPPAVSIGDVTATEADTTNVQMTFTVPLSVSSGKPVTVNYAFADLAATASVDYVPDSGTYSGTITIPAGIGTQSIVVFVMPDLLDETLERFRITLSTPTNATLGTATALGTIVDNDPPTLTIGNVTVKAGQPAQFTGTLTTPAEEVITVHAHRGGEAN